MSAPKYLVIFAKAPRMGRVKTRLARDIGGVPAWAFYRGALGRLIRRLNSDPRWKTVIAAAPDSAAADDGLWPSGVLRMGQGEGDLGERMQRTFDIFPPGPVVIIGADIPGITPAHINAAFRALGPSDAVFGTADDGGYWLVGQKRRPRIHQMFRDVRWSGPHALSDTLKNLAGADVHFLGELIDVDDGGDYARWRVGSQYR